MNLKECLDKIDSCSSDRTKKEIRETSKDDFVKWHFGFGRWIRNNCGLWTVGTKDVVDDIQYLLDNGYEFQSLNSLLKERLVASENDKTDYSLEHPDNVSIIIIEAYRDYLDGKLTLNMLP